MKKLITHIGLKVLPGLLLLVMVMWGLLLGKQFMCDRIRRQRQTGGEILEGQTLIVPQEESISQSTGSIHLSEDYIDNKVTSTKKESNHDDNNDVMNCKTEGDGGGGNIKDNQSEMWEMANNPGGESKPEVNNSKRSNEQNASDPKGNVKNYTTESEFYARKKRIQDVCWKNPGLQGDVREIFSNKNAGILYCVVPKAGCTFWKRIFRAFERKPNPTKDDVYYLSRAEIHDEFNGGKGQPYNLSYFNMKEFPTRLLVTRDPFSRLLSAYLDKIYLPDFWNWETKQIAQELDWKRSFVLRHRYHGYSKSNSLTNPFEKEDDFLRKHFEYIAELAEFHDSRKRRSTEKPTQFEKTCGKYLSFSQFVYGTIFRDEPHWEPIHTLCNPCSLRVTHVSSLETFNQDARPLLSNLGLGNVLDDYVDNEQIDKEISTIVDYNFERVYHERESHVLKSCINPCEMAFRLWNNFRWRGYIDPEMDYFIPEFADERQVREDLLMQLWRARSSGLQDPEKMNRAKKEFREQAFASLDVKLFETIVEKYKLDIELFGYEEKLHVLRKLFPSDTR